MIEVDGMSILNMGSANLLERTMKGLECDVLLSGISRWQKGFPELLMSNLRFKCLIPTHHDDFYLTLDQFRLRNDLDRLLEVIPNLPYRELKILDWITL